VPLPLRESIRFVRSGLSAPTGWSPLVLALTVVSCGGGTDLLLPGDGQPAAIQVHDGDGQSGRVGEPLNDSLVFLVTDSRARPVEGAQVVFLLADAGPGAAMVPDTATTDANGMATARFQLGTRIGPQAGQAMVVVPEGTQQPSTRFSAVALSETANGIAAVSGDNQAGPAGSTLPEPLVVQVTDGFGNPIPGVTINWSADGGGSVSESTTLTDVQGQASVTRTLGPAAGPQSTSATSEGLAGSPVTFSHTATAGNASLLSIVSGNNQTAEAGTELPGDLVVRLVDAQGNGVPGAAVTWVIGTGGGRLSPENTTTDEAGRTSSRWTLGPNPGGNRADAVVSGVGVVHFDAVGTSAAPPRLVILTQPPSSARNAAVLDRQPVIQVRDAGGQDVLTPGIQITAQLTGGSGELLGTRQLNTDANGRVAFSNLAIAQAQGRRSLVFTAVGYAGATSSAIDVQAIPTTTTITNDSPDPSAAGALVTVSFQVSASGVTPLGTVTVNDGDQSCVGTLSGGSGSCQLPLNTPGQRTLRATYGGSPGLLGSSGTAAHQVNTPPPGNSSPHAEFRWQCNQLSCSFTDASTDSDGQVVSWSWDFGDGQSSTDRQPTHTFPAPGTYTVTLVIADDDGAGDQAQARVDVKPPPANKPPHAEFDVSCSDLSCTFTDRSTDDDGTITSRLWDYGDGTTGGDPSHTYAGAGKYKVTLTVTDNAGATDSRTHDAEAKAPQPGNQPPTAAFTSSCSDLTCSFNSDGSSDPDGRISSRTWDFGDSHSSNEANPSHGYSAAGTYTVTLTVTDDRGTSSSVSHQVGVTQPNQPPRADFDVSCPDLTCSFSDRSSDPDGTIVNRQWDYGDGTSGTEPSHTYASPGKYKVTLTVTDDAGASNSKTKDADAKAPPPNQPPVAAFTSSCSDLSCSFDSGGSSDPDGTISSRVWDFGDGSSSGEANPSHTYTSGGSYTVKLTVTDNDGATGSITHQINVSAPNQAPTAAFTSSCSDLSCSFDSSGSGDPDGTIQTRTWDFGDGASANQASPSHTYGSAGTYTVKLTVTDNDGSSTSVTHQVTATAPNQPPTAAQSSSCSGLTCSFDSGGSQDPDGTITARSWDFGDGTSSTDANPSHTYSAPGTYTVILTVTDNDGASDQATDQVSVTAP
jgi:PKD repeat protein